MRSVLAFVAVSLFFVAINGAAAGVMYLLLRGAQLLGMPETPWVTYPLALAGVAFGVWLACWSLRVISRSPFHRRA